MRKVPGTWGGFTGFRVQAGGRQLQVFQYNRQGVDRGWAPSKVTPRYYVWSLMCYLWRVFTMVIMIFFTDSTPGHFPLL